MKKFTRSAHFISNKIGKAIGDYNLIEKNDKILIAVSGGKDSLTLLRLLRERQKWSPVKYELFAVNVKTDFHCASCTHEDALKKIFDGLGVKYVFSNIKVLDENNKTTCFWCSWNRRKELFNLADKHGCNKVALGHHKDDIIETTLMNMLFNGEFASMNPRQELFEGKLVIIRPLCYVEENIIKRYAKESGFTPKLCKCPFSQDSRRKFIKEFIREAEKKSPNVRANIFNSASRIKKEYLGLKEDLA